MSKLENRTGFAPRRYKAEANARVTDDGKSYRGVQLRTVPGPGKKQLFAFEFYQGDGVERVANSLGEAKRDIDRYFENGGIRPAERVA